VHALKFFRKKRSLEQDLNDEFEAHLALESQLLEGRGLTREEAEARARRSFGNRSLLAEQAREAWIWIWLDRLGQDLRYAARTLLRNPAFTPAAVLSIALGIGAGTAVYSIADTVFLRPLPYPHPEQLTWVAIRVPKMTIDFVASPDYVAWRRDNHVFQDLAAMPVGGEQTMLLNGENAAEVHDVQVSANFLRTLDVQPSLGRDFLPQEELPNNNKAVLLTDHLWRQRFRCDPAIVGKTIQLDGEPYTVAGVLSASFEFPTEMKLDLLTALPVSPSLSYRDRDVMIWAVYGRLKPGVTMTQGRADLARLFAISKANMPLLFRPGTRLIFEPLQQHRIGDARMLLSVLVGAATCLLLIVCVNVANLLLARWSARSGELAIRAAIGAGRGRLARQLLTEAALLTLLGCILGMVLAVAVLRGFAHYAGNELPRMNEVTLDARVFVIGLLVSLFTTLMFGGLPALQAGRVDMQTALQQSSRFSFAAVYRFAKRALIIGEVAGCLTLLSVAALLLQTLWHLRNDRLGFQPEHVLTFSVPLKGTKLEGNNRDALVREFLDFALRIPGTEAAVQTECTPLTAGPASATFSRSDRPLPEAFHPGENIHLCGVGADYARAANLRVLGGRFFSEHDFDRPDTLAVINETAARIFFTGENAIGKQILGRSRGGWKTVVGIVSDSKNLGLNAQPAPQAYLNAPVYPEATELKFIIRSIGDQHALESAISGKLRSIDPGLIANFLPLKEAISEMSAGARFNAVLVGGFAVIAFLMAVVGVYGVLAFAVTQRTQEIGIRMALGGERAGIFLLILRDGFGSVFIGIASGLMAVLASARYLKPMLYGVGATDAITFVSVGLALTLAAGIAISIPARRASSVDPITALRHQ
jgi:putative ABC transport system permease protein